MKVYAIDTADTDGQANTYYLEHDREPNTEELLLYLSDYAYDVNHNTKRIYEVVTSIREVSPKGISPYKIKSMPTTVLKGYKFGKRAGAPKE